MLSAGAEKFTAWVNLIMAIYSPLHAPLGH